MLPRSYARAAGLKSEVRKVTITRVAENEMEYNRRLELYRKDMRISINNIQKEQERLRKALGRYSRKMKEDQRERAKRLQREFEFDSRFARIMAYQVGDETDEEEEDEEETEDEEICENDEQGVSCNRVTGTGFNTTQQNQFQFEETEKSEAGYSKIRELFRRQGQKPFIPSAFPAIVDIVRSQNRDHVDRDKETTRNSEQTETSEMINPENKEALPAIVGVVRSQNREHEETTGAPTEAVTIAESRDTSDSYVDLNTSTKQRRTTMSSRSSIKPQADESTKKQTSEDKTQEIRKDNQPKPAPRLPDTRDNIYFRGAHGEVSSSYNLRRIAAIIYPIKYGYDDSKPKREITLPVLKPKQTRRVSTKALTYWDLVRRKQIRNRRNPQKPSKLWAKIPCNESHKFSKYGTTADDRWTDVIGKLNLPLLTEKMNYYDATNRKRVQRSADNKISSLGQTSSKFITKSTSFPAHFQAEFRKPGESVRGEFRITGGLNKRGKDVDSKVVWKSVFQKLKVIHALESLSDVF